MSGVETLMPNMAGRTGADPDAGRLADYRARAGANRSAVTPILQGIQGRRTGLIMAKRVSKDSDGFEDIDAFWDMASEANADSDEEPRRSRGSGRAGAASAAAGRNRMSTASQGSSLALGLDDSLDAAALAAARGRKSSLPMPPPPPALPRRAAADEGGGEEEAKTSPTKRVTRRSSGASSLALSLGVTPGGGLDDSGLSEMVSEGEETPAGPLGGKPRRLDFLKGGKMSLGGASSVGGDTPAGAGARGGGGGEEEEPATEEEREEGGMAMGGGGAGFDDDDWAAGNDDGGFGPEDEEDGGAAAMEEDGEEAEGGKKGAKGKKAAAAAKKQQQQKKKPAPRVSEGGEATELEDYEEEDDSEEDGDPTRTGERRRRPKPQAAATRRVRYTEYHSEQQKGKPLLAPGDDDGFGPMGERRSTRRRMQPVAYWRNEKPVYQVQKVEVETDAGGKRKVEEVEVMTVKEIQVVEKTPEPAWARGRGKKRKAAGGKKGGAGGSSKSRKTGKSEVEEKMPAMNPAKIMEAHPTYQYVTDGSGKAQVWDERRAATVSKKVVAARAAIVMRALENGGMPGVSMEAGHAFRAHQITRTADDRADTDSHLAGFPGWVAGHLVVRPRRGKDPENVGPCSQVFHVLKGQRNALELAMGEQQEGDGGFDERGASRFLLSPGDTFFLPPHNTYRLFNHSKRAPAEVFWTIVKPWSEEDGEGTAPAEESQTQSQAAAAASAKKKPVAPARRSLLERKQDAGGSKRRSTATVAAAAAEEESLGSESSEEEGSGSGSEGEESEDDVVSSSAGEEGSEQSSGESGSEEEEGGSDEE